MSFLSSGEKGKKSEGNNKSEGKRQTSAEKVLKHLNDISEERNKQFTTMMQSVKGIATDISKLTTALVGSLNTGNTSNTSNNNN